MFPFSWCSRSRLSGETETMKTIFKAAAFTMGLILGLLAVALFAPTAATIAAGPPAYAAQRPSFTGKVEVRYLSWEMREGYPIAKFEIVNGLGRSLTYAAHSENSPFPMVEVDGERLNFMHCGTGQRDFAIPAGRTVVFEVGGYYFDRVKPENRVNVGFYFRPGFMGEAGQFATDEFSLPADFLAAAARRY
jgi:hypothetical protein